MNLRVLTQEDTTSFTKLLTQQIDFIRSQVFKSGSLAKSPAINVMKNNKKSIFRAVSVVIIVVCVVVILRFKNEVPKPPEWPANVRLYQRRSPAKPVCTMASRGDIYSLMILNTIRMFDP